MKSLIPYFAAAGLLILIAVFADFLTPFDPYAQDLEGALVPPNSTNLLGTDRYGRDVLSRVIVGSQTTLCASLLLLAVISIVGSLIGAICGYKGGRLELYHFDMYRLNSPGELEELGYEDYFFGNGVCLIEWPQMIRGFLPKDACTVKITRDDRFPDTRYLDAEGFRI